MIDLNFFIDIDSIGDLVGTVQGLEDAWDDEQYLDALAHEAHNEVSEQLDMAVASVAATGKLRHVFEYGVPGITPGKGGPPDPLSPAARLYQHDIVGHRGNYQIGFVFRPANVANPMPTTEYTGVPSKYLRKISRRKYIFRNRAMIVENGTGVEIRPKRGDFLFVPFYGNESRNPKNKRGFMMWNASKHGPINNTPGRNSAGTFTTFFESWWNTTGMGLMQRKIDDDISRDTRAALELAAKRSKTKNFAPVASAKSIIAGTTNRARRRAFSTIRQQAIARRGMDRL